MTHPTTTLSVVVPVRDGADYLAEALQSCLSQSRPPTELIVVNDGSTDDSAHIARDLGVRVLDIEPTGLSGARNHGVRSATGDFIAFLDADDRMTPTRLARQWDRLEQSPEIDGILGHMQLFAVHHDDTGTQERAEDPTPGWCAGTLTIRRTFYLASGGMDESLDAGEFIDWLLRSRRSGGNFVMTDDLVLMRRVHDRNMTRDLEKIRKNYLSVIRKNLDRQRATNQEASES